MEMMLWNALLSAIVGVMLFMLKGKFDEIQRLSILLNRTREEVARDHITRAEVRQDLEKIREHFDSGFERLEKKIDALAQKG
jgi:Skp family chaperone for outer membrane proteins